jgi:hypothetical protein
MMMIGLNSIIISINNRNLLFDFFDVGLTTITFVERFNGKDKNGDGRVPFEMIIGGVDKDDNDEFDVVIGGDKCLADDNGR